MKNFYQKLNEMWLRCKKWSETSILGDFVFNAGRAFFFIIIAILIFYALFVIGPFKDDTSILGDSGMTENNNCSVIGINLHGSLRSYIPKHAENDSFFDYDSVSSEYIVEMIKQANEDPEIKAVVIEVDSSGGSPVAGEEIDNAVKNSEKPVVAFIRSIGASASYLAISSADKIYASKYSDVGGIGVTQSYLSNVGKNQKDGYVYEQLSSGKYKDTGSPDRPLSYDERQLLMRDVNIMFENFVEAVSKNRNVPIGKVRVFADGSTVLGEKAKELGLVDSIGGIDEVEKYLEETKGEKPEICWQ